jgi:predicted acetyltransferase
MTTDVPVARPLAEDELEQLFRVDEIAFLGAPHSEEALNADRSLFEPGRSVGVFDGPLLAAGGSIFSFGLTVPGGASVPMAGVTYICVLPTHRRRGMLTALMRRQLHGLHEAGGEPIAGLIASEAPIYGRFGYGLATYAAKLTVPRPRNTLRLPAGTDQVRLRLVETASTIELAERIYARQVPARPGMLTRSAAWAAVHAADIEEWRSGRSKLRTVVAERDGKDVGYARYRTKDDWGTGAPQGQVHVQEIYADAAPEYAALLRFLLDIDLTSTTSLPALPLDSIPVQLLADIRSADMTLRDGLYVRLVDVERALPTRTFSAPVDVVLDLADEFCPWNAGRWRLTGDEKGASCERTNDPADLALGVRELGAVFLGGPTLRALAAAGLVEERRAGALTEASRAFAGDIAPWLSYGF